MKKMKKKDSRERCLDCGHLASRHTDDPETPCPVQYPGSLGGFNLCECNGLVTKKSERERKSKRFKVKDERSNANERYHAIPQDLLFINALLYLFCEECEKGRAVAWDESEGMYYHTNTRHKCEASQIREQVALLFGKALAKDRFIGKLSQPSCGYCGERNPLKPRTVKTSKGIFCNGACQKDSENYDKVLAKRVLNGEGE